MSSADAVPKQLSGGQAIRAKDFWHRNKNRAGGNLTKQILSSWGFRTRSITLRHLRSYRHSGVWGEQTFPPTPARGRPVTAGQDPEVLLLLLLLLRRQKPPDQQPLLSPRSEHLTGDAGVPQPGFPAGPPRFYRRDRPQ